MNKEELMIGDWVFNTHNQQPEQVVEIRERMVMLAYNDLYDYDEIEPILLTSEVLESNGFKKFNFHDIEDQHQWSWWHDTLTSVTLWTRELKDDNKDGWMLRIESQLSTCCLRVDYIHQLQHCMKDSKIKKEIKL